MITPTTPARLAPVSMDESGGRSAAGSPAFPGGAPTSCRAREILELVGDKWSLLLIYTLGTEGTLRFSDVRRRVPAISQRMLTVTLRNLERDGLVTRALYAAVPPRVEYALTPLGATLMSIVTPLIVWADAHVPQIDAARAQYDSRVRAASVTDGADDEAGGLLPSDPGGAKRD